MTTPVDRSRWESLLEDLGLPVENAALPPPVAPPLKPQPAPVPPPAPPAEEPAAMVEEVATRGRRRRPAQPVPAEVEVEQVAEEIPEVAQEEEIAPPENAEETPETDVAPGRRRRRARGSRRNRPEPVEASESAVVVVPEAEPIEAEPALEESAPEGEPAAEGEEPSRPRRRRRSRSRSRGKKPPAEMEAVEASEEDSEDQELPDPDMEDSADSSSAEEEDEEMGPRMAVDDDDEELDDLSNWNVPSWQELIASLYRPDR